MINDSPGHREMCPCDVLILWDNFLCGCLCVLNGHLMKVTVERNLTSLLVSSRESLSHHQSHLLPLICRPLLRSFLTFFYFWPSPSRSGPTPLSDLSAENRSAINNNFLIECHQTKAGNIYHLLLWIKQQPPGQGNEGPITAVHLMATWDWLQRGGNL